MKTPHLLLFASFMLRRRSPSAPKPGAGLARALFSEPPTCCARPSIHALSRQGYFEQPGHVALAIGFLSTLFVQNPDRVDGWLLQLNGLPLAHHRLIAAALWQAGHPWAVICFTTSANSRTSGRNRTSRRRRERVHSRYAGAFSLFDESPLGAFLASGDERHILSILDAIGTDRPGLDAAARTALAQSAANYPRVLEICQAQLARQPEEVRSVLRAALNDAATARPRG